MITADAQSAATKAEPNQNSPERFLSTNEVAEILGVSRQSIWRHTRKGTFRAYGKGTRMIRYKLSEIEAAMAAL